MRRMGVALVVAGLLSVTIPGGAVHAAPEAGSPGRDGSTPS
ncbi:hypothetical protein HD597_008531 [Nonomuraea thailandensis]|uniref:Uncharacterized protein n=1 Tax=Nonomuraea thailandensis TaxID=1188745 RepID=A0A9X2K968_9ACTN|nr:hypothetical protein [Nonomuraea thailandensis]MCP2361511.1 hypothetical protein [Nonomuraea thailandensis]